MKTTNQQLESLLRAAGLAPEELPAEAPFGFELRALAEWPSGASCETEPSLAPMCRRAVALAGLTLLISVAVNYRSLSDAGPNVLSMVDSAIKMSMLP